MRREKPIAGPLVVKAFEEREHKAIQMILNSGIKFIELGIFGSYARNEYRATSDIDILAIADGYPDHYISGMLHEELNALGVDLIYAKPAILTEEYSDLFSRKIREDYIRRAYYEKGILRISFR